METASSIGAAIAAFDGGTTVFLTTPALAGGLAAAIIAFAARRAGALSTSGAIAATGIGWAAMSAGVYWGVLLIAYFVSTSWLSHWQRDQKGARTRGIVEKGGRRDARQVVANGGVFAIAAAGAALAPSAPYWMAIGAGALAASAADSWGTEIGVLSSRPPRSILTWRPLPAGTSGGVSILGLFGSVAGAVFVGALCAVGGPPRIAVSAAIGGLIGALADSAVGAAIQSQRRCDSCSTDTEQLIHHCGALTRHVKGLAWLENDGVNVLATLIGAIVASVVCLQ